VVGDVTLVCCLLPAGYLLNLLLDPEDVSSMLLRNAGDITSLKTEKNLKWRKLNPFRFSVSLNTTFFK
jgi:hypothetical protein